MRAMLAKETNLASATGLVMDAEWVFEQKLDGHRVMALVLDEPRHNPHCLELGNRNGDLYTKGFPSEAGELIEAHFRPGDHVDGELVGDIFWAFDMVASGVTDITGMEYVQRRQHLKAREYPFTLPQARTSEAKARLMRRVRDEGGEGIIAKHLYSPYQPGARSTKMLKAKYVKTIDCIVTELQRNGKDAIGLGVIGPDGLTEIGACSMIGKVDVEVGDVVEVRYLYANDPAKPRLYQPSFLGKRDDKAPSECMIDQLVFTDKSVVVLP